MHPQQQIRSNILTSVKTEVTTRQISKKVLEDELVRQSNILINAENFLVKSEKSIVALQKLLDLKKSETTEKIERLLSFGLQNIFEDDSYQFKIIERIRRKQVMYDFRVFSNSFSTDKGLDIMQSKGGGIVNIVSFLLRLILLIMIDKKAERFFILDEPFTNISVDHHERLVEIIRQISEKLNVQLLIITHLKSLDFMADSVYIFTQDKSTGITTATKTK